MNFMLLCYLFIRFHCLARAEGSQVCCLSCREINVCLSLCSYLDFFYKVLLILRINTSLVLALAEIFLNIMHASISNAAIPPGHTPGSIHHPRARGKRQFPAQGTRNEE